MFACKPPRAKSNPTSRKTEHAVDVKQQIANCKACRRDAPEQKKETLLSHAVPNKPWRKVGIDIFTHSSINYLVIVDYFSDYFEFEKLSDMSSAAVIEICKRCFARPGIPETDLSFPHVNLLSSAMSGTSSTQPAAVSLLVEWESRVKCQISEETLETSCRSTTCAVRIQKHDYSWYDNKPDTETVESIHEVYQYRSWTVVEPMTSNRTEKERKRRRTQYHYNKHARDLPPIKEVPRYS